jgi:CheY-like chemotaxis protein
MDGQMPVLDGYEAARQIRASGRCMDVPILAVTARAMAGEHERCLAAGMTDFLSKPLQEDALEAALIRALSRDHMPAAAAAGDGGSTTRGYDPNVICELFPQKEDARELAMLVMDDLRRSLGALESALMAKDFAAAGRAAHSIAGVSGNVSATATAELARRLEATIEAGETQAMLPLAVELRRAITDAVSAIDEWLQSRLNTSL